MTTLRWNDPGTRVFQTGLDRGVIFLEGGRGVPWNGLISVNKEFDRDLEAVYYDGIKVAETPVLGEYKGSITAFMYPPELETAEGTGYLNCGTTLGEQAPKRFALSYRTLVGTDTNSDAGYKLHIVYNLLATPSDREFVTVSDDPEAMQFEWDVVAIAEDIPGFRPSAEIVIDSRKTDKLLLAQIEEMLYGSLAEDPYLPTIVELVDMIDSWVRLSVTKSEDEMYYTVVDEFEDLGYVSEPDANGLFVISSASCIPVGQDTLTVADDWFFLSDLKCVTEESYKVLIRELGDYWQAESDFDGQIVVDPASGLVVISEPNILQSGPDMYVITDSV
jgi:hypothetical protein